MLNVFIIVYVKDIDKLWTEIMHKARYLEKVTKICDDTMVILLPYMFEQLELCQKSLAGYRKKKIYFIIIIPVASTKIYKLESEGDRWPKNDFLTAGGMDIV